MTGEDRHRQVSQELNYKTTNQSPIYTAWRLLLSWYWAHLHSISEFLDLIIRNKYVVSEFHSVKGIVMFSTTRKLLFEIQNFLDNFVQGHIN